MDNLEVALAEAIRDACADDKDCAAQGNSCLDVHPIHMSAGVSGKIVAVDADVDALAVLAARVFRARCCVRPPSSAVLP